jgi:hypothetical protein
MDRTIVGHDGTIDDLARAPPKPRCGRRKNEALRGLAADLVRVRVAAIIAVEFHNSDVVS